ncbi:hypothetical protein [Nocardia cyriacigeorgica]|uniref:hypothetical protein n=2 Tax=Nocardia cyriacigeorgica TaxID=135487 RepID=UPI0024585CD5|nr:hypothetical protein [Nocardia cyriacigeorgica]
MTGTTPNTDSVDEPVVEADATGGVADPLNEDSDSGEDGVSGEDTDGDGSAVPNRTIAVGAWKRLAVWGALLVVIVAAAVVTAWCGVSWRQAVAAEARNNEVLSTASEMSVNLVTMGHSSADSDLARILDGTTGDFRAQFASMADGFRLLLDQGEVQSSGQVAGAGIVEADNNRATVLCAVTSTVKNSEAPDGEIRVYRMKLSLDHTGGRWLVSNVEFVA